MIILIVLAVLTTVLLVSLVLIHRVRELHHGFYGAILGFTSVFLHWHWLWTTVGLILLLDDTVQHAEEALRLRDRMGDFTPIHKLGAYLMAFDWKKQGMWLPLAIIAVLFAAAVFSALHFGV